MTAAKQKILEKLQKLMALQSSSNEHEAAAAAARAAELMAAHQIDEAMLDAFEGNAGPIGELMVDRHRKRVSWKGVLAMGVAEAFSCAVYYGHTYAEKKRLSTELRLVGREDDRNAASYMYRYLSAEVDRLAKESWLRLPAEKDRTTTARRWKNGFRLGAADVIAQRLREQRRQSIDEARRAGDKETALVKIDRHQQELEEYMGKNLNLSKGGKAFFSDKAAFASGGRAGRRVHLGESSGRLGAPAPQLKGGK